MNGKLDMVLPPCLSKEEEKYYLTKHLNGDKKARDILIEHNLRLVVHVIRKFEMIDDINDLISIGTIGLIKGIDTFDPGHNVHLSSYCARCIQNELMMNYRVKKRNKIEISMNETISEDKDGDFLTFEDILEDHDADLYEKVCKKNDRNSVRQCIKQQLKNERDKYIIIKRYGFIDDRECTQRELADELGISRSYVSRIERRLKIKLEKELKKNEY